MTLLDLARLMRRYLALVVALPLACALACGGFLFVRGQVGSYTATSYIVTATVTEFAGVNGLASSLAREASGSGYSASVKADSASLTVSIAVTGPDAAGCVERADAAAEGAVEEAQSFYGEGSVSARVERASDASRSNGSSPLAYVAVAFLVGLFLAVCVVVAADAVRRPVKSAADLAEAAGAPVLAELPGEPGDRLLASARLASGRGRVGALCVVPVSDPAPGALAAMVLSRAASSETASEAAARGGPTRVAAAAPALQGGSASYDARRADAAVVAAAQWSDTRDAAARAAEGLRVAGADVVGCVLVSAPAAKGAARRARKGKGKGRKGHAR